MAFTEGMINAQTLADLSEQISLAKKAAYYEGVRSDFLSGHTVIEDKNDPMNDQAVQVYDNGTLDVRPFYNCDWA
jgi:hypothetical protein